MMECLICRRVGAPSHVMVYDTDGRVAGEVCGSHTLREIVMDGGDRFQLGLFLVPEEERSPAAAV